MISFCVKSLFSKNLLLINLQERMKINHYKTKTAKRKQKLISFISILAFILNSAVIGSLTPYREVRAVESSSCEVNLDVVFIIDRSDTMNTVDPGADKNRLRKARSAAIDLVTNTTNLNGDDQSGLISFSDDATLNKSLSGTHAVADGSGSTEKAILDLGWFGSGNTNMGDAIKLANQQFAASGDPQAIKLEILLTDGQANRPFSVPDPVQYAKDEALSAAALGIKIYTVGLGSDVNAAMLQEIATSTDGNYYFADTSNDLDSIFTQIQNDFCNQYGAIGGCKYNDTNNDGDITDEPKLAGWKINLSGDDTQTQQTDADGCYLFNGLLPGNYTVSEDSVQEQAFTQTYPSPDPAYNFELIKNDSTGKVDSFTSADFGNYFPPPCGNGALDEGEICDGSLGDIPTGYQCTSQCALEQIPAEIRYCISGFDYNDADGLASTTDDRSVLPDWEIKLYATSSEGSLIATTSTNTVGYYEFLELLPGNYSVMQTLKTGWLNLISPAAVVTLVDCDLEDLNFVNYQPAISTSSLVHDLAITKSIDSSTKYAGDNLTYTITVANHGTATATDVVITDTWPGNLIVGTSTPSIGTTTIITATTTQLTWNINELAASSSATWIINATVKQGTAGQAVINVVSVEETEVIDEKPSDNTATSTITVSSPISTSPSGSSNFSSSGGSSPVISTPAVLGDTLKPVLVLTKAIAEKNIYAGYLGLDYIVTVENTGKASAVNLTLTDTLPDGLKFSDTKLNQRSWNLAELAVGAKKQFAYKVDVPIGTKAGTYTNTVSVKADNYSEITATASVTVKEPQVLGVKLPETGINYNEAIALFTFALSAGLLFQIFRKQSVI